MTEQTKVKDIRRNGKIATLCRARKEHTCKECLKPIPAGSDYYSVVFGGSGVSGLCHPARVHVECISAHLEGRQKNEPNR